MDWILYTLCLIGLSAVLGLKGLVVTDNAGHHRTTGWIFSDRHYPPQSKAWQRAQQVYGSAAFRCSAALIIVDLVIMLALLFLNAELIKTGALLLGLLWLLCVLGLPYYVHQKVPADSLSSSSAGSSESSKDAAQADSSVISDQALTKPADSSAAENDSTPQENRSDSTETKPDPSEQLSSFESDPQTDQQPAVESSDSADIDAVSDPDAGTNIPENAQDESAQQPADQNTKQETVETEHTADQTENQEEEDLQLAQKQAADLARSILRDASEETSSSRMRRTQHIQSEIEGNGFSITNNSSSSEQAAFTISKTSQSS